MSMRNREARSPGIPHSRCPPSTTLISCLVLLHLKRRNPASNHPHSLFFPLIPLFSSHSSFFLSFLFFPLIPADAGTHCLQSFSFSRKRESSWVRTGKSSEIKKRGDPFYVLSLCVTKAKEPKVNSKSKASPLKYSTPSHYCKLNL